MDEIENWVADHAKEKARAAKILRPGTVVKHFKGKLYQVIGECTHTETGEALVVYQALYGERKIWCRPKEMFLSRVDRKKYPRELQEYRMEIFKNTLVEDDMTVIPGILTEA